MNVESIRKVVTPKHAKYLLVYKPHEYYRYITYKPQLLELEPIQLSWGHHLANPRIWLCRVPQATQIYHNDRHCPLENCHDVWEISIFSNKAIYDHGLHGSRDVKSQQSYPPMLNTPVFHGPKYMHLFPTKSSHEFWGVFSKIELMESWSSVLWDVHHGSSFFKLSIISQDLQIFI